MVKITTHYDNLQVARNASPAVIRAAYKSLTQRYHPDRNPNDRAHCERVMKIINQAYEVLSDPAQRREHDAWIVREEEQARRAGGTDAAPEPAHATQTVSQQAMRPGRTDTPTTSYASAAESFRASRMHRATAVPEVDGHSRAASDVSRAPSAQPPRSAPREAGVHGAAGAVPWTPTPVSALADSPKPAGFLYVLIVLLKFGGVLTGLALYGQLSSANDSIRPEFATDWTTMKLQLWLVWGIAVAMYFAAGQLLASRRTNSARWQAMGLIWAGALLAPLIGLLIAPMGLPHDLAMKMPVYYVPKAIRAVLFATTCTLYVVFSQRVRRTYSATTPGVVRAAVETHRASATPEPPIQRERARKRAAEDVREYAANAGWSALTAAILWSQTHQTGHATFLPTWATTLAGVGVWVAAIACVGFVIAALASKLRARG